MELLRIFSISRGWVTASGLPDEARAGRKLLKNYVDGILLYCKPPPNSSQEILDLIAGLNQTGSAFVQPAAKPGADKADSSASDEDNGSVPSTSEVDSENKNAERCIDSDVKLDLADLDLLDSLHLPG